MNTTATLENLRKMRMLTVTFDQQIPVYHVGHFRAAVASKVGLEHDWFHNHNNRILKNYENKKTTKDFLLTHKKYHYRFPKIQYKIGTRCRPMIVFLEECVEEAHRFFSKPDWSLNIAGKHYDMRIDRLDMREYNMQVWERDFSYRLYKWQALNSHNFAKYNALKTDEERHEFLSGVLVGNLLSFATGLGWQLEKRLEVDVTNIIRQKRIGYKRMNVQCFDVEFNTNMFLPQFLSVGKGGAKGFGVLRNIKKSKNNQS